jgi:coatomer subunit epsilon
MRRGAVGRESDVQAQLHNGLAAANMKMGRWDEADTDLQDALKKDDKDADTLSNLVACMLHLGKPFTRHLTQLKMQAPAHALLSRWTAAEAAIDRAALASA